MLLLPFGAFTCGAGLWYVDYLRYLTVTASSMKRMLTLDVSALSANFWQLLCSRFVLGLGSCGITLLSMIIINGRVCHMQLEYLI